MSTSESPAPSPPAATLLVVDDDPTIRMLAFSGLARRGFTVVQASDGEQGLSQLLAKTPDLALIDVSMPKLDGFELVKAVREGAAGKVCSDIPLLMLTGADDVASINHAFEAGATDFITKPINIALLAERIKYALRGAEREKALRESQLEQASACKLARLGFWQMTLSGGLQWSLDASEVLDCDTLPIDREALLNSVQGNGKLRLTAALDAAMASGSEGVDVEVTVRLGSQTRILHLKSNALTREGRLIGAFQDVTALRAFEDKALYLAEYDELTDLPRRRLFLELLKDALTSPQAPVWSVTVIDISRLHRVNDLLGIRAGDQVLAIFAQRLKSHVSSAALLCRLEADTFVVATPHQGAASIKADHQAWMHNLARAYWVEGEEVFVDFTAGVSVSPDDAQDGDELIRTALLAQRFCRHQGSHLRLLAFSEVTSFGDASMLSLETDLRRALERNELSLVFQPQQQLSSGKIPAVEALLRWQHASRGMISPGQFIPLLEESGLILEVGDWVIDQSCRQLAAWHRRGLGVRVGINLSAQQFEQPGLAHHIAALVEKHGVTPDSLELEITESIAMRKPDASLAILHELKRLGFNLALDDFGTGHSSYEYLLRFPFDTLKIDRSFVTRIAEDRSNRAIVRSLTALSKGLGLKTIAEGVETLRQRDYLDALDVDDIQGYLLARPLSAEDCAHFLDTAGNAASADQALPSIDLSSSNDSALSDDDA